MKDTTVTISMDKYAELLFARRELTLAQMEIKSLKKRERRAEKKLG